MTTIAIDQTSRTLPIPTIKHGNFEIRYAFYPKLELFQGGERGEDYLVFRVEGNRLAFALCDGVGGSYYGSVAAQTVGEILVDTLWKESSVSSASHGGLTKKLLDVLNARQSKQIADTELRRKTEQLSPNLRKRLVGLQEQSGSQSNFVCGLVDLDVENSNSIWLLWLGDARLRVYQQGKLQSPELTGAGQQAWSSHLGVLGQIETAAFSLNQVDQIIAYSDGLDPAATLLDRPISDGDLTKAISDSQQEKDDDVSFLEIRLLKNNYQSLDELAPRIRSLLNQPPEAKKKTHKTGQTAELGEASQLGVKENIGKKNKPLQWVFGAIAMALSLGLGLVLGGRPAIYSITQGDSHRTAIAQTSSAMIENIVATLSTLSSIEVQAAQSTMQADIEAAVGFTLDAASAEQSQTETLTPTGTAETTPAVEAENTATPESED
ncbi:MAG: hypothetical protein KIT46_02190 [Anaerolineales bacterium]|nr:hypothetical protein [Anaerolineales bacterium]MCW5854835.1 hypothetical protein [Anaerolineales bacterium]